MGEIINAILDAIIEHFFWEKLDEEGRKKFRRYGQLVSFWLLLAVVGFLIVLGFIS